MRLGGEDWVDVGLVESVVLHAFKEEANGAWHRRMSVSEEDVSPAPLVRRPPDASEGPSTITEPEIGPWPRRPPDLESNGRMAHSLEVSASSSL